MLVATSLMYSEDEYEIQKQTKAMQTWKDAGFDVISCNVKEEIDKLQVVFPQVVFVELSRSGKEKTGKPFPYIYDILQALDNNVQCNKEICGIVNSDIFLKNIVAETLKEYFAKNEGTVLILHRYDIEDEQDTTGEYYFSGIDAFFFLKEYIPVFPDKGFMLGRPEWDPWFLSEAVKAGMKVREVKNKVAFHIKHKQRWTSAESNNMVNGKTKGNTHFSEEYYRLTNDIMCDLSNRVVLKDGVLQDNEVITVSKDCFYDDVDRENILKWEKEVYGTSVESKAIIYCKGKKAYKICALHREVISEVKGKVSLGTIFANERDKGAILRYIDFKDLDFVKDLGRTYIYPAGRASKLLLDCMITYNIPVLGMVDRDASLWGTEYLGHRISGLDVLSDAESFDHVLIASNLYVKDIYESLKQIVDEDKLIVL